MGGARLPTATLPLSLVVTSTAMGVCTAVCVAHSTPTIQAASNGTGRLRRQERGQRRKAATRGEAKAKPKAIGHAIMRPNRSSAIDEY